MNTSPSPQHTAASPNTDKPTVVNVPITNGAEKGPAHGPEQKTPDQKPDAVAPPAAK